MSRHILSMFTLLAALSLTACGNGDRGPGSDEAVDVSEHLESVGEELREAVDILEADLAEARDELKEELQQLEREEFRERMERELASLDRRIGELRHRIEEEGEAARPELRSRLETLEEERKDLVAELEELGQGTLRDFGEAREQLAGRLADLVYQVRLEARKVEEALEEEAADAGG